MFFILKRHKTAENHAFLGQFLRATEKLTKVLSSAQIKLSSILTAAAATSAINYFLWHYYNRVIVFCSFLSSYRAELCRAFSASFLSICQSTVAKAELGKSIELRNLGKRFRKPLADDGYERVQSKTRRDWTDCPISQILSLFKLKPNSPATDAGIQGPFGAARGGSDGKNNNNKNKKRSARGGSDGKNNNNNNNNNKKSSCIAGDLGSIPGLGRSPGGGMATHSDILSWRIPMDRGAWRATVHQVAKSRTRLND